MAQVSVKFTANTSGFQKGINAVKAGIGGLAATVGTVVAPLAALASLGAVLGAAFKGVKLAADMEATSVAFETLLGSATDAKKVLADITTLAAKTPYGLTDLTQAARSLLSITGKEKLTPTLKMIGDLASASQKPITDLASMFAKIKGGDVVQGEDLNQIADALGGAALQEFARVLGVDSIKAVRKLGSESKITGDHLQKVFENLTAKGGMAFNAMEAQSRTFNGLLSTLADSWEGLLREFGKPIMSALKPFLNDGISLLENLQQKARAFGEGVAAAVTFLRNAFKGGELLSLFSSGLLLTGQSFVNLLVKGLTAAGAVILNAFMAAGELLFGVFSNGATWDQMRAQFDVVGLKIQRAIVEAIPEMWQSDKSGRLGMIDTLTESRQNAADNYGAAAGRRNAELFGAAADALRDSGRVFANAFKGTGNVFDTAARLKQLQERWNALSKPAAVPPAGEETKDKAKAPAAPTKRQAAALDAQIEPVLSSLARIGGARAFTSNPLVALQTTANGYLETIAKNSGRGTVAVLA